MPLVIVLAFGLAHEALAGNVRDLSASRTLQGEYRGWWPQPLSKHVVRLQNPDRPAYLNGVVVFPLRFKRVGGLRENFQAFAIRLRHSVQRCSEIMALASASLGS
jgi:hypothetical protein